MIFSSYEDFTAYARKRVIEEGSMIFFMMKTGYSMKDLLDQKAYTIEIAQPYYEDGEGMLWFNDWYEGQQYIEVYDAISEDELIRMMIAGSVRAERNADEYSEGEQ